MLLATKTVGATGGGAGVGVGVAVAVGSGVGVALAVAETVAVGTVDGAGPATLGVPQAASNAGAIKVSSTFLVIRSSPRSQESCSRARYSKHMVIYLAELLTWNLIGSTGSLSGGQPCSRGCRLIPTTLRAGSHESRHAS